MWTNVEDEILKAAISKYGKNQWARISSLLVRKTPKQCKARWYEWLDPGIRKVEWTKEEDEKLLHLAKLLPNQWRTMAPIVGRTATQCLERYQKLLDDAEAAENDELGLAGPGSETAAPTADSIRKLRPGEVDPDPESKPAKPDAIDMDEDEKEMLSEARARLANTQGKKAKRKARERLLDETKRLSVIQKRRELKAAGISIKLHHRKKGDMDYNADIPFEHKPALGFYDTTEETEANEKERAGADFRKLEQKRREDAAAAQERKVAKRKDPSESLTAAANRADSLVKLREAEQLTKRRKLNLPAPQVSEQELENIIKLGLSSTGARELVVDGDYASNELLGEYNRMSTNQPLRTPRTPAQQDNVALEARNLRALTNTQSSLFGAENTPLHDTSHGTGYEGATPRRQVAATPNLLTSLRDGGSQTPIVGQTPSRTPRDSLFINREDSHPATAVSIIQDEKAAAKMRSAQLRRQLDALPIPKNDFELQLPDDDDLNAKNGSHILEEDAEERDRKFREAAERANRIELAKRSLVVQKNLPRPSNLDANALNARTGRLQGPERLIAEEMTKLMVSDALRFPLEGTPPENKAFTALTDIDIELMESIRDMISQEAGITPDWDIQAEPIAAEDTVPGMELYMDNEGKEIQHLDLLAEVPSSSVLIFNSKLQTLGEKVRADAVKANKLEKRLGIVLGGYQSRCQILSTKLEQAFDAVSQTAIDLNTFSELRILEDAAVITRTEVLQSEVAHLSNAQKDLQERYALLREKADTIEPL